MKICEEQLYIVQYFDLQPPWIKCHKLRWAKKLR